ncbi:MAG: NAD(P)H-hydrate epimerase, partial [Bacteroidia bacterium]|nr:NAD(P)H-hydrate epimerase [Bacteroidia bacterium]
MKILSSQQIHEVDQYTIQNEPISSIKLMERASWECTNWIKNYFPKQDKFFVFCGMGNNGGDGMAIARQLDDLGKTCEVYFINIKARGSSDFETNKQLAIELGIKVTGISSMEDLPELKSTDYVIDAIFGSGLSGNIEGLPSEVIQALNDSNAIKIAIDIPSGLYCEDNSENKNTILKANHTLSLHLPKLALLLPENSMHVGNCEILPIGLDDEFIAQQNTDLYYTTPDRLAPNLIHRAKHSHKGTFGHALIISGMKGKMGATILAAKACLRSGVGLLTVHVPACGYQILQISVPEAMVD